MGSQMAVRLSALCSSRSLNPSPERFLILISVRSSAETYVFKQIFRLTPGRKILAVATVVA
jgi:hypothetical protein